MIRILFLIILIIQISDLSFGQTNDGFKISLRAITPVANNEYFIDIVSNADSTKAIFRLRDSISENFNKDIHVMGYKKKLQSVKSYFQENDTVSLYLKKLDSICTTYTFFSVDSIVFPNSENEKYLKLTRQVFNSSNVLLENKIGNKNRFLMDGTWMTFILTSKGSSRVVSAHSPNSTSNPILYSLITATTTLYRQTKNNNFLNKQRTCGY